MCVCVCVSALPHISVCATVLASKRFFLYCVSVCVRMHVCVNGALIGISRCLFLIPVLFADSVNSTEIINFSLWWNSCLFVLPPTHQLLLWTVTAIESGLCFSCAFRVVIY